MQKSLRESQTARSSDTECPADSDACCVSKAAGDEGPRGPQSEEERGAPGEVGSFEPAVRFTEI